MQNYTVIMNIKKILTLSSLMFSSICVSQYASATCWSKAGGDYNIDPLLLMAIGWQESNGRTNAVGSLLKDGNRALGLMQINTIHLPELEKFGIKREHLFEPCVSVMVGAYVLRDCLDTFNQDTWRAVGCYYGGKYSKAYTAMSKYSKSVRSHYENYQIMFRGQNFAYTAASTQNTPQKSPANKYRNIEYIFFDQ